MNICSKCGAELKPSANFCTNCGASVAAAAPVETVEPADENAVGRIDGGSPAPVSPPPDCAAPPAAPQRKIENHLIRSIIAAVCCCMPLGVVGIVYAAKVDALLRQGDLAAAEDAGKKAALWSILAIGVGLTVNVLTTVLMIMYRLNEGMP